MSRTASHSLCIGTAGPPTGHCRESFRTATLVMIWLVILVLWQLMFVRSRSIQSDPQAISHHFTRTLGEELGSVPLQGPQGTAGDRRASVTWKGMGYPKWQLYWGQIRTNDDLVGGLEHFLFSRIYGIILPIDFHIFQDG